MSRALGLGTAVLIAVALRAPAALAQTAIQPCGDLTTSYGPYDYRTDRDKLPIVDNHHFTPQVEALIRGVSGPLGAELSYVLAAFPNHHRALNAMIRLTERDHWQQPVGARYDVDCYFDRALRFRPDDVVVRLLYVTYLVKRARRDEAKAQLAAAARDAGNNGLFHFNIGLLYLDLGEVELAREHARRAQALDFSRPELIERLRAIRRWDDAVSPSEGAPSAPARSPQ